VAAGTIVPIDHDHAGVGLGEQDINEGHPHPTGSNDQVVGVDHFH
jgi:hypothetical protein